MCRMRSATGAIDRQAIGSLGNHSWNARYAGPAAGLDGPGCIVGTCFRSGHVIRRSPQSVARQFVLLPGFVAEGSGPRLVSTWKR